MNLGTLFASLGRFFKKLNPVPPVGALAIGDSLIRFLLIEEGEKLSSASLRLPPGIVEKGLIRDARAFTNALKELRASLHKGDTSMHVIFSLPPGAVYVQPFSLPILPEDRLAEAASLNLQMISPLDFSKVYGGYQKIGDRAESGGGIDMLGAFVEREIVQQFSEALQGAGFAVVAVEFPALAIARLGQYDRALSPDRAYIMVDIGVDGLSLMILRNASL